MSVAILHAASHSGRTLISSERPSRGGAVRRRMRGRLMIGTTGTVPVPCSSRSISGHYERAALEGDRDAIAALAERLAEVPTPAGPTPEQLGADRVFVALTAIQASITGERP